ncbi:oligopeptide ABC transporter ATP-binding protein OppF [Longispora fulva]|uniref:Peptide/nickel transport system ATP-binding protein n=1 Tax=Longispora fulva TaxID=619741 RepID=A0A8J7GG35_9ACTN|nr:ABC transporter ATP-binding protein [Longispora fulva]MBG6135997.1 peptide/nickel transport system ATP-binding protein [Longispora fulva]GIG55761.1 oligopeptide ABC transporter ATP-binding protein OppF [Longispora fulva]
MSILEVRDLVTRFHTRRGVVRAVDGVSFDVEAGETVALVGESGSGKSVTAMSILNMVRAPGRVESGQVRYRGRDVLAMGDSELRRVRGGGIGMIFQDPMSSLNPVMRIRDQLTEAMLAHGKFTGQAARDRAVHLMGLVGIPDPAARLADYPHAFSGGMRQRVMIAMAVANAPDVIIADEPTTALDVTVQAQILDLLASLNRELGTAVVLITHNLGVVARLCQRVNVMYGGRIVESATVDELFAAPRHPYTRGLLAATPRLAAARGSTLTPIDGRPPDLIDPIQGCAFAPRCAMAREMCTRHEPALEVVSVGHRAACWLPDLTMAPPDRPVGGDVPPPPTGIPLLEVRDLTRHFPVHRNLFGRARAVVRSVDGVNLTIAPGETLGLVGESGCGKSTLGKVLVGIHPATSGTVTYEGADVTGPYGLGAKRMRRNIQMVFQDPYSSLNPRMSIGRVLREPLDVHGLARGADADRRVAELLELVGLAPEMADRYPHEFSGGQRQRIAIARALAVGPRLIVCDEPVSALDVSLQAQVINLLRDLQRRLGLAYLFIAHDLAVVRHLSHRIAVMYLGQIVEIGPAERLTEAPLHPYTASLLSAVPEPDPALERRRERILLTGDVPSPLDPPPGCRFHGRCPIGPAHRPERVICATTPPPLTQVSADRYAACHFPGELTTGLHTITRAAQR